MHVLKTHYQIQEVELLQLSHSTPNMPLFYCAVSPDPRPPKPTDSSLRTAPYSQSHKWDPSVLLLQFSLDVLCIGPRAITYSSKVLLFNDCLLSPHCMPSSSPQQSLSENRCVREAGGHVGKNKGRFDLITAHHL